jgi:tetratricopeptide (TPR) repeat protein
LILLRALLIVAAGFWIFAPSLRGGWLMDDDFYLPENPLVNDPARLWKIWFAPGSLIEYYPIEASLQAIQWHWWHGHTLGYHLTNLLLHATSALLVWRLLAKFGLKWAWLGGFLFAIHPVTVESVAWIAEFKNTLSLPPFLLAMCAWIDYQRQGRPRDYLLALGCFLLAMLCKISMALFPLVILLFAWWQRGRVGWRDVLGILPFAAISVVLGITTILVGTWFRHAHLQPADPIPIGGVLSRLALAGTSLAFYLGKCVWPVGLLPIYPRWTVDPPSLPEFLPWVALGGVIWVCWMKRAGWGRHVLLGLGFFFINLLPFLGLNSSSYMASTWVMDHFLYLPLIGVVGLIVTGLELGERHFAASSQPFLAGALAVVLALLAFQSHAYAAQFTDQETLWTYTIKRNPGAWLACNNLGNMLFQEGRIPEAIERYRQALQINPEMAEAHSNLGLALEETGHAEEAIDEYERALKINPHLATAQVNLGYALTQAGRTDEAMAHYREALEIDPGSQEARDRLADLQALQKKGADPK